MTKTTLNDYKINELTKEMESLRGDVNKILTNHLPHLKEQISDMSTSLEKKMIRITTRQNTTTALNIGAVIIGALILKYL